MVNGLDVIIWNYCISTSLNFISLQPSYLEALRSISLNRFYWTFPLTIFMQLVLYLILQVSRSSFSFSTHMVHYFASVLTIVINDIWKGNCDRKSTGKKKQDSRWTVNTATEKKWAGGHHGSVSDFLLTWNYESICYTDMTQRTAKPNKPVIPREKFMTSFRQHSTRSITWHNFQLTYEGVEHSQ